MPKKGQEELHPKRLKRGFDIIFSSLGLTIVVSAVFDYRGD